MHNLSIAEKRVADLVALGHTNAEIANLANCKEKTVKFHVTNIFKKLKVRNRVELCRLANNLPLNRDLNGKFLLKSNYTIPIGKV